MNAARQPLSLLSQTPTPQPERFTAKIAEDAEAAFSPQMNTVKHGWRGKGDRRQETEVRRGPSERQQAR